MPCFRCAGVDLFSLDSLLRLDGVEADESSAAAGVVGALVEALGLDSAPGCGGAENAAAALGASGGEFTAVASGGSPQHALLAVAVAGPRNLLLLRGSDGGASANGGGPEEWALRVLPWLDGARAAVQHLAFAAPGGADRLLAATVAGGVYVLDAAAALQPEAPRSPGGVAPTPPVGTLASAGPPVAALAWWTRRQDGCDVALAATRAGDVRLWDGASGTPLCAVAVPGRLRGMLLLPSPGAQSLLLWGDAGPASYGAAGGTDPVPAAAWSLQLEREADGGGALPGAPPAVECLPDASGRPGFSPQPLAGRFGCASPGDDDIDGEDGDGDDVALSLQPGAAAGGGPLVARFSRRSGLLRLYDPASPAPHPAAEHALPPGTVALRVTPRLVYCVHPAAAAGAPASENGWALSLIARHAAPRAFRGADAAQQLAPPLVLQRLRLAGDFSRGGGLLAPPGAVPAGPAARHHAPPVPGALLWSPAAVLRTAATAPPEALFCALLGAGRDLSAALGLPPPPEVDPSRDDDEYADCADGDVAEGDRRAALLGTALALDTAWLYKQAARECVRRGQLRRARRLFTLAGADPVDVVGTCLAEGRADEALAELAAMDAQAASRSVGLAATPGTDAMPRLRLACLAHLQLSAWAAAAAAAALQAAPPAAAAAAAEAAAAVEGTAHMMSSSAAAAAAAAVAEALQNESPDVSPDDAARVAAAAASACSAAAAAAAVATGLHDDVLRDGDEEEEGESNASSSHDAAAADANAATSEAMLRLMLACGRVAEALCAQGVALAEGGGGPWLEEAQRDAVCAAAPRAEDAVAARRGSVHAAAAAAAAAPPGTPPPALALLDDDALLRLAAATAKGAAAPPRGTGRVAPGSAAATAAAAQAAADAEAHVSALFALAARSGGAASERDAPQQRRLEAAITTHWSRLTPWRLAAAAEAWRNPAASGLVAQLRGDWAAAVRWRLAAMEARWRGRGAPAAAVVGRGGELAPADEADVEELAAMLSGPAANATSSTSSSSSAVADADRRAAAMAPAVIHWQRRGFPQPRLEAFLLARARASPAAAEAAVALLAAARAGALHLSGRFALRLAALRCADASAAHAAAHPLPPDALWRQVRGNLTRRMGTPTAIRFQWPPAEPPAAVPPPPPPPSIAAPPAGGEDGDIVMLEQVVPPAPPPAPPPAAVAEPPEADVEVVAFSCGHAVGASRLATVLVPRLTQRLAQLRGGDGLRLSRTLLAQEYDCGRVALACPACVAAAVAQQAAEVVPASF